MAQDGRQDASKLAQAIDVIEKYPSGPLSPSLVSALDTLLAATRIVDCRAYLNEHDTLPTVLRLYNAVTGDHDGDKGGSLELMRCIGNLVADNDANRTLVMADPGCLKDLQKRLRAESMQLDPRGISEADSALAVLYNLCNDNVEMQQSALKKDLHISIFEYIHARPWNFGDDLDDQCFDTSITLLTELLDHRSEANHPEHFSSRFTSEILRLPCLDRMHDDLFPSAAECIQSYLKDAKFHQAVLENRQLPLLWSLLEKAASVPELAEHESARAIEKDILNVLSDISNLEVYPAHLQSDYAFVRVLTNRCILTENDWSTPSTAMCACILLGNLATTDENAAEVVTKLDLTSLFDHISLIAYGRSKSASRQISDLSLQADTSEQPSAPALASYLHAAGGMLRHLSRSQRIRKTQFANSAALQAAVALSQYSHIEVQITGLRLYRQLVATSQSTLSHSINEHHVSTLLRIFADSSNESVKLEVSRTIVVLLRALSPMKSVTENSSVEEQRTGKQVDQAAGVSADLLSTFLAVPDLTSSLLFALTRTTAQPNSQPVPALAQAESWFGLVLLALSDRKGKELAVSCLRQSDIWTALEEATTTSDVPDSTGMMSANGEKTRMRDNAIAFAAEMRKQDSGLEDEYRERLESLLQKAGIDIQQRSS